ncbi:MAG: hypothetical protein AAF479_11740, partial [Pseudomonadota bacterium]
LSMCYYDGSPRIVSAIAAAFMFASLAGPALAEYPGEIWSIDAVEVRVANTPSDASTDKTSAVGDASPVLRRGLRQAGEIYFFGERAARLRAEIRLDGTRSMRLSLIDRRDGRLVARSPQLPLQTEAASVEASALAWLETLNCADAGCAVLPTAEQPVRVAKARIEFSEDGAQASSAALHGSTHSVPVPRSRPVANGWDGRKGRAKLGGSRLAAKDIVFASQSLQIAWAIPREVGALTYGDSDKIVVDSVAESTSALGSATTDRVSVARAPAGQSEPLVSRVFSSLARFFGLAPEDAVAVQTRAPVSTGIAKPKAPVSASSSEIRASTQPEKVTWSRTPGTFSLINPAERLSPASSGQLQRAELRLAALDAVPVLRDPGPAQSAGNDTDAVDPIRAARRARAVQRDTPVRSSTAPFKVRLHPELLGRYGLARANDVPIAGTSAGAVRTSLYSSSSDVLRSSGLDRTLENRGLKLDVATYSRFERFYWSGYGEEGFWISLPNRIGAEFVLVSGPESSVIAAVRQRDGIAKTSPGVAEALGLRSRRWAKLRVIALRGVSDQTAKTTLSRSFLRKGRDQTH